jgi:hypothetical protein
MDVDSLSKTVSEYFNILKDNILKSRYDVPKQKQITIPMCLNFDNIIQNIIDNKLQVKLGKNYTLKRISVGYEIQFNNIGRRRTI